MVETLGSTRTVTAFFDTVEHANQAKVDLIAVGIPDGSISIVGSNAGQFTVADDHQPGFWEALGSFFMLNDDKRTYAEGLRRGGFAISVETDEAHYAQAIDVLDRDGAVDLDERSLSWEQEGWSRTGGPEPEEPAYAPADNSTAGFGGSRAGQDGIAHVDEATNPDVRERIGAGTANWTAPAPTGGPQTYDKAATPTDDVRADVIEGIPGAPGSAEIRRDTSHGRSRIRSYIVEGDVNR